MGGSRLRGRGREFRRWSCLDLEGGAMEAMEAIEAIEAMGANQNSVFRGGRVSLQIARLVHVENYI